ncbi:hypothetical protein DACRYDRAFT_24321, partial [Dacryopinax primogenitus]
MAPLAYFSALISVTLAISSGTLAQSFPRQTTSNIGCIPPTAILSQLSSRDNVERAAADSLPCSTTCFNGNYQYAATAL